MYLLFEGISRSILFNPILHFAIVSAFSVRNDYLINTFIDMDGAPDRGHGYVPLRFGGGMSL